MPSPCLDQNTFPQKIDDRALHCALPKLRVPLDCALRTPDARTVIARLISQEHDDLFARGTAKATLCAFICDTPTHNRTANWLAAIDALTLTNDVCERFKKIGDYDFASEISVTVLGHIFEQSIADVERLQAIARGEEVEDEKAKGTSGRRKRDGVVYTPDYIARFIVEQTVGTHIREIFDTTVQGFAKKGADVSNYVNIPWKRKSAELEAWRAYRDSLTKLRIVDPACGSGVFLVMAFDFLKAELNRVNDKVNDLEGKDQPDFFDPDSEILTNNLFGVDVNSESVEIAKLSLWIKTARRGKVLDSLDENIMVGDSLIEDSNFAYLDHPFTWQTAFPDIFAEGGFDIVLGNPPYVRQELFSDLKPYLKSRFESYHGVADLFCYFYERGLRLMKDGGRLGYISSNTFFKTGSGQPLRKYLMRDVTIEGVVDFGDLQVFEGVTTYPAILVMKNETAPREHIFPFWKVEELPTSNFRATYRALSGPYTQSALTDTSWRLESPALRALRAKISHSKKTLKEVYGSPFYGIKTGLNAAFVIDTVTKDRLCAEDPKSAELLKPFLEGKDLKRWRAEPRSLWLIFTRRGTDINAYPAIKAYLETMREALEPKPKGWIPNERTGKWPGRKAGSYKWFEIQDTVDYHEQIGKPKILYPEFCDKPQFQLNESHYFNNKCYFVSTAETWLAAYLNSKLGWFVVTERTVPVRGGFHQMHSQFLEKVILPEVSDADQAALGDLVSKCQQHALARHNLQAALTHRIPDLCPPERDPKLTTKLKDWWLLPDFAAFRTEVKKCFKSDIPLSERNDWEAWITRDRAEIARLTAEIAKCEAQINAQVYALFDLTPDEIALLESAV